MKFLISSAKEEIVRFARRGMIAPERKPLRCFLIAGETSGDQLGAELIRALHESGPVEIKGVGGAAMVGAGLTSLFPMTDIAVMGLIPVLKRLPLLIRRINATVEAILEENPDIVVLIDAPDFTHRVAKKVRARAPHIPIIDYVSPTVWAWRPGRARKMRSYIDHLMAILPFEPEALEQLGGPPTSFVGHPIMGRLDSLRPPPDDRQARNADAPIILLLPGSRGSEVRALTPVFLETARRILNHKPTARFVLPAVPHLAEQIRAMVSVSGLPIEVVGEQAAKEAAFRSARAALAASGTVSLELAMAKIPMVIGYRVSRIEEWIVRRLVLVSTVVLPNLIVGNHAVPEFLQEECNPDTLCATILPLLDEGTTRQSQLDAFQEVERRMAVAGGEPSAAAARLVRYHAKTA